MSVKGSFDANVKFRLGDGRKLFFWLDVSSLIAQFPRLHVYARDCQAAVREYMGLVRDRVTWGPIFRRNLGDDEKKDLFALLYRLSQFSELGEGTDGRVCVLSKDGIFSVASFFCVGGELSPIQPHRFNLETKRSSQNPCFWMARSTGKHSYHG